jgi:hypothetical protein
LAKNRLNEADEGISVLDNGGAAFYIAPVKPNEVLFLWQKKLKNRILLQQGRWL